MAARAAAATSATLSSAAALLSEGEKQGRRFLKFVNETGSPYHSVHAVKELLRASQRKFLEVNEFNLQSSVKPGEAYYMSRNNGCIAAFVVGRSNPDIRRPYVFSIIGTHTDSPCLRLRPNCSLAAEGTHQVGVECYGGGLWHTWLDRGLGLAGVVYVKEKGRTTQKLVRIAKPLLVIPSLAIHLRTAEELAAGLKLSKEKELQPVLCTEVYQQLLGLSTASMSTSSKSGADDGKSKDERGEAESCKREEEATAAESLLRPKFAVKKAMPVPLLKLLAKQLEVETEAILSWDLCLMDAAPGDLSGIESEFINSPRLDNLVSTFAAFDALKSCEVPPNTIALAIGFNHEEVGSATSAGADSCLARGLTIPLLKDG